MPNDKDLFLKYKFTDRGGNHVFDIYELGTTLNTIDLPLDKLEPYTEIRLDNLGRVVEQTTDSLYCDDCDSEFTMSGKTFVGNWEDQNNPDCSHATHITQLCETCHEARRDI